MASKHKLNTRNKKRMTRRKKETTGTKKIKQTWKLKEEEIPRQ
jgi:hypothetical protein